MPQRDQIFVSYSHQDKQHLKRLKVHFKPFERDYSIKVWSDENIQPSQLWRQEIETALKQTAVAILLVSADFLASDFIANEELPSLLDAAQSEGVSIFCFILSYCSFTATSLSKYQAVNDPAKPLLSFNKQSQRDALWVDLVQKATRALDKFKAQETAFEAADQVSPSPQSPAMWSKVATLFWLGNDLMWIQDMTYRDAPPERVLQGINHSIEYVEKLGFSDEALPIQELKRARRAIEKSSYFIHPDEEARKLQREVFYKDIRQHVETVKWFFHELATKQEPEFEKRRAYWWLD